MQKPDMHTVRDTVKALAMLTALVGGGMGIGYGIGAERARALLLDERQDRLSEIARLQNTHQRALDVITGRAARTAETMATVADTAANAAETAKDAATTADKAAATAGKVAKAAGLPAAVLEQDRKAINNTITRTNERIKEGGAR